MASSAIVQEIQDLAIPALGTLALDPLLSIVDTIIVGHGDSVGLAALGLNTFVFSLFFYIFNFFATATGPLVAQSRGAGKVVAADDFVDGAFVLAMALGVVLVVILEWNARAIITAMGGNAATLPTALSFMRLRAVAAPAVLMCSVGNGAFRGRLDTFTPLKIAVAANVVNLALDGLFVLQLHWGAEGAALATDIAEWGSALGFIALLVSLREPGRKLTSAWSWIPSHMSIEQTRTLLAASAPIFIRTVLLQAALTIAAAAAARADAGTVSVVPSPLTMPAVASAAHQVVASIWLLLSFLVDAVAVAAQTLIADARGRGNSSRAKAVAAKSLGLGLACGCAFAAGFVVVKATWLVGVFTSDPDVAVAVAPLLATVAISQPVNGLVFVADGVLQGYRAFCFEACAMLAAVALAGGVCLVKACDDPVGLVVGLASGRGEALDSATFSFHLGDIWVSLLALQVARAVAFGLWWFVPGGLAQASLDVDKR